MKLKWIEKASLRHVGAPQKPSLGSSVLAFSMEISKNISTNTGRRFCMIPGQWLHQILFFLSSVVLWRVNPWFFIVSVGLHSVVVKGFLCSNQKLLKKIFQRYFQIFFNISFWKFSTDPSVIYWGVTSRISPIILSVISADIFVKFSEVFQVFFSSPEEFAKFVHNSLMILIRE